MTNSKRVARRIEPEDQRSPRRVQASSGSDRQARRIEAPTSFDVAIGESLRLVAPRGSDVTSLRMWAPDSSVHELAAPGGYVKVEFLGPFAQKGTWTYQWGSLVPAIIVVGPAKIASTDARHLPEMTVTRKPRF